MDAKSNAEAINSKRWKKKDEIGHQCWSISEQILARLEFTTRTQAGLLQGGHCSKIDLSNLGRFATNPLTPVFLAEQYILQYFFTTGWTVHFSKEGGRSKHERIEFDCVYCCQADFFSEDGRKKKRGSHQFASLSAICNHVKKTTRSVISAVLMSNSRRFAEQILSRLEFTTPVYCGWAVNTRE